MLLNACMDVIQGIAKEEPAASASFPEGIENVSLSVIKLELNHR